jgi:hypothetical protein
MITSSLPRLCLTHQTPQRIAEAFGGCAGGARGSASRAAAPRSAK